MHYFDTDYAAGCHPNVMEALSRFNALEMAGYGLDEHTKRAQTLILNATGLDKGNVFYMTSGTQANLTVISSLLKPYQSVVAADCGHIQTQETGSIEATGHKILLVPQCDGKLKAERLAALCESYCTDENQSHLSQPGLVYLSFPSETGSLYSLAELESIAKVSSKYGLFLYIDGARLAYGLAAGSDVSIRDLARLSDVFYIGGTKCGALYGEAIVFRNSVAAKDFSSNMRMRGALLARGWTLGVQFEALFETGLYFELGRNAVNQAKRIKEAFEKAKIPLINDSPTNQLFVRLTENQAQTLRKFCVFRICERFEDGTVKARFCTSWATTPQMVDELTCAIRRLRR